MQKRYNKYCFHCKGANSISLGSGLITEIKWSSNLRFLILLLITHISRKNMQCFVSPGKKSVFGCVGLCYKILRTNHRLRKDDFKQIIEALIQLLLLLCYNLLLVGVKFQLSEINVPCPFNTLCQDKNIIFNSHVLYSL